MDSEFWISELTDDDVPAVVTLCRAALDLPEDAAEAAEIVLRLRETTGTDGWSARPRRVAGFIALRSAGAGPDAALSGEPLSVTGGRVIGVVLGSVSHRDRSIGHVDLVAVDPQERRRGVARALVSRIEGALAGLGAGDMVIAGNAPYYAWPGIDVRYTPAICAAMAFGFEQDQPAWNMTVDVAGAARGGAGSDSRRRGAAGRRGHHGPAGGRRGRSGAGPVHAGELRRRLGRGDHPLGRPRPGRLPPGAGQGRRDPRLRRLRVVAAELVRPDGHRTGRARVGIGALLLRRCLADQRAAGHDQVQIGWVGPLPF